MELFFFSPSFKMEKGDDAGPSELRRAPCERDENQEVAWGLLVGQES